MRSRYIPASITLTAAMVTCIICIIKGYDTLYSLKILLAVVILFYIIGVIAKHIILKAISQSKEKDIALDLEDTLEESNEEVDNTL